MTKFATRICKLFFIVSLMGHQVSLYAGVVLDRTRVIYLEGKKSSIGITNNNFHPVLVQSWITDDKDIILNEDDSAPFFISPLMARIDPNEHQQLRIHYTGEPLSKDRESVFYINILEVPQRQDSANSSMVYVLQSSRIKLFFRPKHLNSSGAEKAAVDLTWSLVDIDGQKAVQVKNQSPYHVSLAKGLLQSGNKSHELSLNMVAPFTHRNFVLTPSVELAESPVINFTFVDDFGGIHDRTAKLQRLY